MRFMMIMMPKGYESAAPDAVPSLEAIAKMRVYNESLQQAGVLLALDGLLPPSTGARVSFSEGKATVTDGPFAESKEVIGGYWIIEVRSREEAVEWAKRAPMANNDIIEVRRFLEMSDFPEDVQKAIQGFEDLSNSAAAKG
ncbi:MAG: YciI family protein [Candidatus Acidiferrales bacterium]